MLVQAILHEEELTRKHLEAVCGDYFMFYNSDSQRNFKFTLEDNDFGIYKWFLLIIAVI